MKRIFLILTIVSTTTFGQSDEAAVRATVDKLFTGMRQSDTAAIRSVFGEAAQLQTLMKNKEGKLMVVTEPIDSFLVAIVRPHKEIYDERITVETLKIDGDLAMVWAPYKFYVGEQFSHCGVDAFQLVRVNNEWKIQNLMDTRRKQGCK